MTRRRPPSEGDKTSGRPRRPGRRGKFLAGALLLAAALWWARAPLRQAVAMRLILRNPAPNPAVLSEVLAQAGDPASALLEAWRTGGIVHRQVALALVPSLFPSGRPWPAEIEAMVLRASRDPDAALRRRALGWLRDRRHPAYTAAIRAQLADADPDLRLLGLQHARSLDDETAAALAVGLLEDPDPTVQALAIKTVERLAGTSFGVRMRDIVPTRHAPDALPRPREGAAAKLARGTAQARSWWAAHRPGPPMALPEPDLVLPPPEFPSAPDFALPDLEGRTVRLSDYRGRVVLLNFWTTWCTACQEEIPALNALQEQLGSEAVILGISLDFVPDTHGHVGGHSHDEPAQPPEKDVAPRSGGNPLSPEGITAKVRLAAKRRGIRYRILLDPHNQAGALYQGGQLPTTVIVDREGRLRRRFVGARSPETFAAMLAELRHPAAQPLAGSD